MTVRIDQVYTGAAGYFRIFAYPPHSKVVDITAFRGKPTQISSYSTTDPFGDATAQLTFPQITGFEKLGQGDLGWLVPWVKINIVWYTDFGTPSDWVWEGFYVSDEVNDQGTTLNLKGALYELDNYLAAPWFPQYPVPYELLIRGAFDPSAHLGLRTNPLSIEWPEDWNETVPNRNLPGYLWFLRPWGISPGTKWTGLTSRNTGSWEPLLTGFVQSLLSVMYTPEGGQWTIEKLTGGTPLLKVRKFLTQPDDDTLHVYYGAPGVKVNLSRDFTQSANVIYGEGRDLAGSAYSGQEVSSDGQTTYYEPFAALPYVWPATKDNPRLNSKIIRKESRVQFPEGMAQLDARQVAAARLQKFADPGYVGNIELEVDPLLDDSPYNRMLIRAGQNIMVHNIRGTDILFHITETNTSPMALKTNLTIDSKYRDALTVYEVKAKTRDALDPVRLLRTGAYSTTVQDTLLPWSYTQGSGILPSGGAFDATPLFIKRLGDTEKFPWLETVQKYPPKKYPKYYVRIGPRSTNATNNWAGMTRNGLTKLAIPVRMSQNGTIRLTQIAAYDEDGNILPVRFHISFYANEGVGVTDMPMIPASYNNKYRGYDTSQRYPFFPGAFENITAGGQLTSNPGRLTAQGADMAVGFGNYFEGAGYFPGQSSRGDRKTGLLNTEEPWSYDTTSSLAFDKYSAAKTQKDPTNGLMYAMIYCDDQGNKPVYFLGRMFRSEG